MTNEGAKLLSIAILQQAIDDKRKQGDIGAKIGKFTHSKWCGDLCEMAGIDQEVYARRVANEKSHVSDMHSQGRQIL